MSKNADTGAVSRLRKIARQHGWKVSSVKAAPTRHRPAIDLVAERDTGVRTVYGPTIWERIEVKVSDFGVQGFHMIGGRAADPCGGWKTEEDIAAALATLQHNDGT